MKSFLMILVIVCGANTYADENKRAEIQKLRAFFGPLYQSAFRNDTCENVKNARDGRVRIDANVLATSYLDTEVPSGHIDHVIMGFYLTSTDGIRMVEVREFLANMFQVYIFRSRSDGQKCEEDWVSSGEKKSVFLYPKWRFENNELVIETIPEIRMQNVGGQILVRSELAEQIIKNANRQWSQYPMIISGAGWRYPSDQMPYCDPTVYCNQR